MLFSFKTTLNIYDQKSNLESEIFIVGQKGAFEKKMNLRISGSSVYLDDVPIATYYTRPNRVVFTKCPVAFQLAVCQFISAMQSAAPADKSNKIDFSHAKT
jgi:hypothetical protein